MADSRGDKCSKMGCSQRFKKFYSIELGKRVTVGQLYRGLELHTLEADQEDEVQLSLAMDRQGKSRGLAFLRTPIMLEKHVLGFDGRLLKGEKLRIKEEKHKRASLLKKMRWVRDYKTTTAATVCLNQPLHHDCYRDKTDPQRDEEFSEPVFDVGARLFHRKFEDDLDSVLAKAYKHGIRKINIPCYNMAQCEQAVSLVNLYKGRLDIYFSAGIGPRSIDQWNRNRKRLEEMCEMPACSSVGLIGIDLRPETLRFCRKDTQLRVFEDQIKLACKYQKPVLFVERCATDDVIKVLNKYSHKLPPCALYCKCDEIHDHPVIRSRYIDLGCYIVVGACVEATHFSLSSGLLKCIENKQIPTDKILIASDSPGVQKYPLPLGCHVPTEDTISRCFLRDSVYDLVVHDEYTRLAPPVTYLTMDLLANALGRQVGDRELTKTIYDNTLKFFRMEQYRDRKEKMRSSCLRSVQAFLSSHYGQARELLVVVIAVFILVHVYGFLTMLFIYLP